MEHTVPVSTARLDEILAAKQRRWDYAEKRWDDVVSALRAGTFTKLEPSWGQMDPWTLSAHMKREGYSTERLPVLGKLISTDAAVREHALREIAADEAAAKIEA